MGTRCVDVLGIRHEVRAIDHEHNERVDPIVKPFDNLKYRPNHYDQECRNAEGSQICPLLLQRVFKIASPPKMSRDFSARALNLLTPIMQLMNSRASQWFTIR